MVRAMNGLCIEGKFSKAWKEKRKPLFKWDRWMLKVFNTWLQPHHLHTPLPDGPTNILTCSVRLHCCVLGCPCETWVALERLCISLQQGWLQNYRRRELKLCTWKAASVRAPRITWFSQECWIACSLMVWKWNNFKEIEHMRQSVTEALFSTYWADLWISI